MSVREFRTITFLDLQTQDQLIQVRIPNPSQRYQNGDWLEINGFWDYDREGNDRFNSDYTSRLAEGNLNTISSNNGFLRRNRHLDIAQNSNSMNRLRNRFQLIQQLRQRLVNDNYLEVTTPILSPYYGGATANPFITEDQYLRIAPELHLIQLMSGGLTRIFEIGQCFRNESRDHDHNPEFTSLELYNIEMNWDSLIYTTQSLCSIFGLNPNVISMQEFVYNQTGEWLFGETLLDQFENYTSNIQEPTIVTHYPASINSLSENFDENWAMEFEIYSHGMELGHGYISTNNFNMVSDISDPRYINCLETGMPRIAGLGLGIDRLCMIATDTTDIRDIIPFPFG